jgi:hypothetical protein
MQISSATKEELGLLISGLRAIYIHSQEPLRRKLAAQLETELTTRFGLRVGGDDNQERNMADDR